MTSIDEREAAERLVKLTIEAADELQRTGSWQALVLKIRAATIEDCAKLAEARVGEHGPDRADEAMAIARAIRALADKEPCA